MNVPTIINAGDKVTWTETLSDYPATIYTLAIDLRSKDRPPITITAATSGTDYLITVLPVVTKLWKSGIYQWQAFVYTGSGPDYTIKTTIERGTLEILPNLTLFSSSDDTRSIAKLNLDMIEAVLSGDTSPNVMSYSIGGRSLSKRGGEELRKDRDYWKTEYQRELDKERQSQGNPSSRQIGLRFQRL